MMGYTYGWIIMFGGGLIIIGIIALIIYALVRMADNPGQSSESAPHDPSYDHTSQALAILAERYAKGEISDEEYQHKKSGLTRL